MDYQNLFENLNNVWVVKILEHPSTFNTFALDMEIKNFVLEDLWRLVKRKRYYKRVGNAWKIEYLLYEPPRIRKSSLITILTIYLNFDIYDLELIELKYNLELQRLLISIANRSILVVEDIDYIVEFQDCKVESELF